MSYALPRLGQDDARPSRLRVLVADDDEINRRVLAHILIRLNHEVKVASSGLEALMEVAADFFDVLFMDLHMPDLGGLEATRLIMSAWTPQRRPLIVGLTADSKEGIREACIAAGMSGFLSKPAGIGSVRAALEEIALMRRPQSRCTASMQPGLIQGN